MIFSDFVAEYCSCVSTITFILIDIAESEDEK